MPLPAHTIETLLRNSFPDAVIQLVDTAGDQDHYDLTITAQAFVGKSRIEQHKMVYAALGENMGGALHALKLTTKIP